MIPHHETPDDNAPMEYKPRKILTKHYIGHPFLSHTIIPLEGSSLPTGIQDPAEGIMVDGKTCDFCEGTGKVKENDYETTMHKCEECDGLGAVEVSDDEDFMSEVSRREERRENQNRHDL